jgi:2-polyprenyl-3-methyl-5-hydroxy-6-metoxy-1,4-benzoquinol methylase
MACSSTSNCKSDSNGNCNNNTAPPNKNDATPISGEETRANVAKYYGQVLASTKDLKTNACCTSGAPPKYIRDCLKNIHPKVLDKYYGCGLCLPQYPLEGATILDLGCGAGRDVYLASQLVGPKGKVVGVDMTLEQLETARAHLKYHEEKFGYANVEFHQGYLELLSEVNLPKESFDVIISNCVINLCSDKEAVLSACWELLKPGGELYFSDVYANRRVPMALQKNEVLWGECLSGALYWNDFQNMAKKVGFTDPRLVEDSPITIQNSDIQQLIKDMGLEQLKFYSATYRLWKLPLEPHCEDYGQAVIYKGTMERYPSGVALDKHHYFEKGRVLPVCGNTYMMLHDTRFKDFFDYIGTFDTHYGIMGPSPFDEVPSGNDASKGSSACGTGGCC